MPPWIFTLLLFLVAAPVWSQTQKDPLTEEETEKIREYADRPPERVKLYMKFIEQRTAAIRQTAAGPKAQNRSNKLRNLIEEFTRLVDELQDNLDVYSGSRSDVRKVLKDVVDTSSKWPAILDQLPPDHIYDFSRKTALDAAQSANDAAKQMLAEQEQYFAGQKAKGKERSSPRE